MLRSPNRTANQIRRYYKSDKFDWTFDSVTVTCWSVLEVAK